MPALARKLQPALPDTPPHRMWPGPCQPPHLYKSSPRHKSLNRYRMHFHFFNIFPLYILSYFFSGCLRLTVYILTHQNWLQIPINLIPLRHRSITHTPRFHWRAYFVHVISINVINPAACCYCFL